MLLINELTKLNDIDLKGLKFYERIFLDTLQTFLNIYFNSYYCMFHSFCTECELRYQGKNTNMLRTQLL